MGQIEVDNMCEMFRLAEILGGFEDGRVGGFGWSEKIDN